MKLYCLSGLGVDERAFQNFKPDGIDLIHVPWLDPLPDETLQQYSQRLIDKVQPEDNYNLLGVSFGGMIAAEFSRIKRANTLFLVSTIQDRSQLRCLFKAGTKLKLHKLIPISLMKRPGALNNFLFGVRRAEDKELLREILNDTDPAFLKWAINAVANWQNPYRVEGIRIHGSFDKLLPLKSSAQYILKKGGHFMIANRGKEIAAIVEKEMFP